MPTVTPTTPPARPAALLARLRALCALPLDQPALMQAQFSALSAQLPMMYAILLCSSWMLVASHAHSSPPLLTVWVPAVLSLACLQRLAGWWRFRHLAPTVELARRSLQRANQLSAAVSAAFICWALALYPYGSALEQTHVLLYATVTPLVCLLCLLHVRRAMLTAALLVNLILAAFLVHTGVPTLMAVALNVVLVNGGLVVVLLGHYGNFTRLVEAQLRAEALSADNLRLANEDSLTGLPNRRGFFAALEVACANASLDGRRIAVALLDLDGFKPVNDLYGHAAGDRLLAQVGSRLAALCHDNVAVARLGGDEFALIIEGRDDAGINAFAEHVCQALRAPFMLPDATLQVAASMGLVTYPDLAGSATDLYERAGYALHHGKRNHRGLASRFSDDHREQIQHQAVIEQALRLADLERELRVMFQPIVNGDGSRTLAFEALARWNSPSLGAVSPAIFVPVAERAGLINAQTRVLLRKALVAAAQWPAPVRLSFNLSAHDLSSREVVERLLEVIEAGPLAPERLDLEITETAVVNGIEQLRWATGELRALGCGVSLDDFGTGYSSLSQLHALPLTKIKIDRSFVHDIQRNPASFKIVKSLLALGRDMELGCVVEGVETASELAVLRGLGGCMLQGWLFAAALSETDVAGWLQRVPGIDAAAAADTVTSPPTAASLPGAPCITAASAAVQPGAAAQAATSTEALP